jgi:hypothetical protein
MCEVKVITGIARQRRLSTDLKLAVVTGTMRSLSIGDVARRHGQRALPPFGVPLKAADERRRLGSGARRQ